MVKNKINENFRCLNLAQSESEKITITPDSIPTLIPADILNKWQDGDSEPFYKLQKIDYPIVANRLIYEESFFESFIGKLKNRPIPGSKEGHSFWGGEKPPTDFILIGAKMEPKGDGTGSVFFKNYIPPQGATESNDRFILENKSDMIHYSLVTWPKTVIETDEDGERLVRVVESIRGERNDAVEFETSAMKQVTNNFDEEEEENKPMKKNEILAELNTMRDNNQISIIEIAKNMGVENMLVTEVQLNAVKLINSLSEAGIKDPVAEIKALKDQIDENADRNFNSTMTEKYGPVHTEEAPNLLRNYAQGKLEGKTGEELKNGIDELSKDPIALKFAAERADVNSDENNIGKLENKNKSKDDESIKMDYSS